MRKRYPGYIGAGKLTSADSPPAARKFRRGWHDDPHAHSGEFPNPQHQPAFEAFRAHRALSRDSRSDLRIWPVVLTAAGIYALFTVPAGFDSAGHQSHGLGARGANDRHPAQRARLPEEHGDYRPTPNCFDAIYPYAWFAGLLIAMGILLLARMPVSARGLPD
ncbi:MAG: hypothetical protein AB7N53_15070 [Candidatus Binatia bacterium]